MSSILKVSEIQDPTNGNTALTIDSSGNMSSAGHVVQVVQEDVNTQYSANNINTQTFIRETAFTAKYANSKLIIMMNVGGCSNGGSGRLEAACKVSTTSGGTSGTQIGKTQMALPGAGTSHLGELNGTFEYTNTTTSTQYIKIVAYKHDSTTTWYMGQYSSSSVGLTILEIAQ